MPAHQLKLFRFFIIPRHADAVFRHYLGIEPQPGRLKFIGDAAGTAPDDLIVSGDSVRRKTYKT